MFDSILLIIILGFGLAGLYFGFVHTLGSLIGSFFGIYLAVKYYAPVADWVIGFTGWNETWLRFLIFTITFIAINRLVGLLFWFIGKALDIVRHLPIIATLNRLFGFIFGIFEGVATVGFVLFFLEKFPLIPWIAEAVENSQVAPYPLALVDILIALLPLGLSLVKDSVETAEGQIL